MIRYIFKDEPITIKGAAKANPQKIGEALTKIADAAKGRLTPKAVVETARDSKNVLHKFFDWDDQIAAGKWRLDQARTLIRAIRIEEDDAEPVPAFLSAQDGGGMAYHTHAAVQSSADLQLAVLKGAERDLAAFEKRYRELGDICESVREAREKATRRRSEIESRAQA